MRPLLKQSGLNFSVYHINAKLEKHDKVAEHKTVSQRTLAKTGAFAQKKG